MRIILSVQSTSVIVKYFTLSVSLLRTSAVHLMYMYRVQSRYRRIGGNVTIESVKFAFRSNLVLPRDPRLLLYALALSWVPVEKCQMHGTMTGCPKQT